MLRSDPALSASVLMIFENFGLGFVIHEEVAVESRNRSTGSGVALSLRSVEALTATLFAVGRRPQTSGRYGFRLDFDIGKDQ
jgi:pyruvate/2-oxoglutarate dehydrogenase complex dihydrolipoamide dehydrogenase (E3) component